MAEYVDRKSVIKEVNTWWRTAIMADGKPTLNAYIKALPPADVIEREKIDKAIEEMERYSTSFEYANRHDLASAVDRCIGMIEKNIGESK